MGKAPHLKPYHFKKGQSGNPAGGPKLPPELKAIRALTADEITRLLSKFARMNKIELQAVISDPKSTMIELTIAAGLVKPLSSGNWINLQTLLDRTVGKVVDKMEVKQLEPYIVRDVDKTPIMELGAKVKEDDDGESV